MAVDRINSTSSSKRRTSKDTWRKYGAQRRKELVAKDETQGGTRFEMSKKCQIELYFRVAEKVGKNKQTNKQSLQQYRIDSWV